MSASEQTDSPHFKCKFHITHVASLFIPASLSCKYCGIVGERFSPQKIKEVFIAQQLAQGCDGNHEFRVTKPGFLDHEPLFLAFSLEGVDQAVCIGSAFLLVGVGVAFFSDKPSLIDEALSRCEWRTGSVPCPLMRLEQLTLEFTAVRHGYVHCDTQRDLPVDGRVQQPFFAGLL